jgi:hypothetical protein
MQPEVRTLVSPLPVLLPLALAALLEPVAWALSLLPQALDSGWYGRAGLLVAVHTLTLGAASAAILGAGWQLVPVVTARAWKPPAAALTALFVVGLPLLGAGLGAPTRAGWAGNVGAVLILTALSVRSIYVIAALSSPRCAPGRAATRGWLIAAELCLWAGLAVGAGLWAGRVGHPVFADPVAAVGRHAALLLGGWVGGSIVGYGSVLLPMFAIAPEPQPVALAGVGVLWFAAAASGEVWLGAAAALLAAGLLLKSLRAGLKGKLGQPVFGLVGLAAVGAMLPWAPGDVIVAAALTLFLLPVLRGMTQKVGPFLAWAHLATSSPALATLPAPPRLASVQTWLSGSGAIVLVAGRIAGSAAAPALARIGAALLLAGALAHIAVLAHITSQLLLAQLRRGAIPGTESAA